MKLESLVDLCANVLCINPRRVDMSLIPRELAQELWKKRCSLIEGKGRSGTWYTYQIKMPVRWDPFVIVAKRVGILIKNYNNSFFSEKAGEKMMEYISTNARFITSKHFSLYYIKQRILSFLAYVDGKKANEYWSDLFKKDIPDPRGIVKIVLCGKRIDDLTVDELKEAIKTLLQILHRHLDLVELKVDAISDVDVLGDMVRTYVKEFHSRHPNTGLLGPHRMVTKTSEICHRWNQSQYEQVESRAIRATSHVDLIETAPPLSPSYRGYGRVPHPKRTNRFIVLNGRVYNLFIRDGWHYDEDIRTWTPPEIV